MLHFAYTAITINSPLFPPFKTWCFKVLSHARNTWLFTENLNVKGQRETSRWSFQYWSVTHGHEFMVSLHFPIKMQKSLKGFNHFQCGIPLTFMLHSYIWQNNVKSDYICPSTSFKVEYQPMLVSPVMIHKGAKSPNKDNSKFLLFVTHLFIPPHWWIIFKWFEIEHDFNFRFKLIFLVVYVANSLVYIIRPEKETKKKNPTDYPWLCYYIEMWSSDFNVQHGHYCLKLLFEWRKLKLLISYSFRKPSLCLYVFVSIIEESLRIFFSLQLKSQN